MSGQSIVDRLNAAKHTVAGSALGRAVVKATTEEIMGPKRKHLDCECSYHLVLSQTYVPFFSFLRRFVAVYLGDQRLHTADGRSAH